jgi:uncharacterized protein (TIGR02001 family)
MNKLATFVTALTISTSPLAAELGGGFDLSGNISATSEYYWRGMDQNSNAPATQGGIDLAHDFGLYFGVWTSNVNFGGGDTSQEVDYYGGFAKEISWFNFDVGMISYQYPGNTGDLEFEESYLGLGASFEPIEFGVTYYAGASAAEDALEMSIGATLLGTGFSVTFGDYDNTGDYLTVVISREVLTEIWPIELALTYTEMDFEDPTTVDDDATIFSISKSF